MAKLKCYDDIIGAHFGNLTVIQYLGHGYANGDSNRRAMYRCQCDCGKKSIIPRNQLIRGSRTTCGDCSKISQEGSAYRYYCAAGGSFLFDKEDMEVVKNHRWYINDNGYVVTRVGDESVRLTHLLLNIGEGTFVDHINGDRRDNRRSNLRASSRTENNRNIKIKKTNRSGYKGIHFRADVQKYRSVIVVDGRNKHLGYFDTPEEAARAYDEAARYYFGEFACVNFPRPGEQGCRRNQPAEEQAERMAV